MNTSKISSIEELVAFVEDNGSHLVRFAKIKQVKKFKITIKSLDLRWMPRFNGWHGLIEFRTSHAIDYPDFWITAKTNIHISGTRSSQMKELMKSPAQIKAYVSLMNKAWPALESVRIMAILANQHPKIFYKNPKITD